MLGTLLLALAAPAAWAQDRPLGPDAEEGDMEFIGLPP